MRKGHVAGFDILRCLLMFGVVLQHTVTFCRVANHPPWIETLVLLTLTYPAVDGFTAISGWFGVKCSWRKIINLLGLVFFCGIASFLIYKGMQFLCGSYYSQKFGIEIKNIDFNVGIFRYWYIGAYLKLLIFSILLNPLLAVVGRLRKRWQVLILLSVIGLSYASLFWFTWVSHSPRTIIFIYVVVRLLMMLGLEDILCWRGAKTAVGFLLVFSIVMMILLASTGHGEMFHNYANPMTIAIGVMFCAFFYSFPRVNERLASSFAYCSKSMVSVYMLHLCLVETVFKPMPRCLNFMSVNMAMVVTASVVFCSALGIDIVRRWAVDAMYGLIKRLKK